MRLNSFEGQTQIWGVEWCEEESFRQTFVVLATGTLLEKAELELSFFPSSQIGVLCFDID